MPLTSSCSLTKTAGGQDMYQPVSGNGSEIIPGDDTVQGNLLVNGTSQLNGLVTAGAGVNVTGAVTATGAVSGSSVTATGLVSAGSFNNTTVNVPSTVQIVTNGVASGGASFSGSTAVLSIPLLSLFPGLPSLKAFQLYISGSSTDRFTTIVGAYSGASTVGVYAGQFQNVAVFDATRNIRGACQPTQYTAPASGDAITMYPDNLILTNSNLTSANSTVFYCVTSSNGSTIAWNRTTSGQATNVWLTLVPII